MGSRLGPTPLLSVDAVALDLETTGLDVRSARIVQIGAAAVLRIEEGGEYEFAKLVDPGVAIPASATAVHGIAADDLLGAARAGEALAELVRFLAGRPVIGHAIGYDIAVVTAEARRTGADIPRLSFLDTRLLAAIVAPSLPDLTLETLAAWLDVACEGRHSAIGDARTAGRIFRALIPHLRSRRIRTWAEAEAACHAQPLAAAGAPEGWAEPPRAGGREGGEALARIDSYPYRHRVADIMTAPPRFLDAGRTLAAAAHEMAEHRISSIFIRDESGNGILTERDLLGAIAAEGAEALERPAAEVASQPLECVSADAFIYLALGRMARLKVRHLGVVDAEGLLIGALSARDLLRLRASEALQLGDAIETAEDVTSLAAAWAPIPIVAEALLAEGVDPTGVSAVVSHELGAATRRAAEMAEAVLKANGEAPPGPYSVLVLGSAGRGESLLALDQDNAIVFEKGEPGGPEDRYFARLGGFLADTLDAIGVPYCKGGVMAREANWRGSVETWRTRISGWLKRSKPEDLLSIDIFFDARHVYGAVSLADAILAEAHAGAAQAPHFVKLLASASPRPPTPFTLFGGLRSEAGRLDLKLAALLPIVTAARVLAMRYGIDARSTRERLLALKAMGKGGETDLDALAAAHAAVLGAILRQQIRDIHAGVPPSSKVETARLTRQDQDRLKKALRVVPRIDDLVRDMLF